MRMCFCHLVLFFLLAATVRTYTVEIQPVPSP